MYAVALFHFKVWHRSGLTYIIGMPKCTHVGTGLELFYTIKISSLQFT